MRFISFILVSFLAVACSNTNEQATVDFETEQTDSSDFFYDTSQVNIVINNDSLTDLADRFYAKYVSMYFDKDNDLIITPLQGGVHFFDPHDSTDLQDVVVFKQFIEIRYPIAVSDTTPLSPYLLQLKIDSLLQNITE